MASRLPGVPHDPPRAQGRHRRLLAPTPPREPSLPVLYYSAGSRGRGKNSSRQCGRRKVVRHKGRTKGLLAFCRFILSGNNSTFLWGFGEKNRATTPQRQKLIKAFPAAECCPTSPLVLMGTGHKICLACVTSKIYPQRRIGTEIKQIGPQKSRQSVVLSTNT